jgi:hypothetical protein
LSTPELAGLIKTFTYQLYLGENATAAAAELNAQMRMALRSVARIGTSFIPSDFLTYNNTFLKPWTTWLQANNLSEIPLSGLMPQSIEDYMVSAYSKHPKGFYESKFA